MPPPKKVCGPGATPRRHPVYAVLLASLALSALASTIVVDDDGGAPDLQTALDASGPGDRVQVMPGLYYGRFTVPVGVELIGAGPEVTTLNGQGLGTTVAMAPGAVLEGFTVTGGSTSGVRADNPEASTPAVVRGNIIRNNSHSTGPGELFGGGAAGILILQNNIIRDNSIIGSGGAVAMVGCSARAEGNLVMNNEASWRGGGFYVEGLCPQEAKQILTNNVIAGNTANQGAGIYAHRYSPDVFPVVTHNTIVGNIATGITGGAHFESYLESIPSPGSTSGRLTNNVIAGNTGGGVFVTFYSGGAGYGYGPEVTDNLFHGNGVFELLGESAIGSDGNISADPLFRDPRSGDYRQSPGSPGIDVGVNLPSSPAVDVNGFPRPLDGDLDGTSLPDLGAHEERGEIEGLLLSADGTTVSWSARDGADLAHLYRGDVATLRAGGDYTQDPATVLPAQRWCDQTQDSVSDNQEPAANTVFFYLVTPVGLVEGSLGLNSNRHVRPNDNPCP